jgi:putative ABC transport system substrate-binding protein
MVQILNVHSEKDFDAAFATFTQLQAQVLIVTVDPLFNSRRDQIIALAERHRILAIYFAREFVVSGGLMSYATDLAGGYRQASIYVARILKGTKPADLPVVQPTKFDLVITLRPLRRWASPFREPCLSARTS